MRATLVVPAVLTAALALAGCSQAAAPQAVARDDARAGVEQLVHPIAYDRNDDIFFVARSFAAVAETSSVQLIGITEVAPDVLGDTFGTLELLAPETQIVDNGGVARAAGPFCFRVAFNYYGAEERNGVVTAREFDCPADPVAITPPPDATVYPVVAVNAREAAREVLTQLAASGETVASDEIAERIRDLLTPPTSDLQTLAEPEVIEHEGRIGVAMQDASECLLVNLVDDTVNDVYPPPVLLQPGELGCSGGTAIADADQLRSPH